MLRVKQGVPGTTTDSAGGTAASVEGGDSEEGGGSGVADREAGRRTPAPIPVPRDQRGEVVRRGLHDGTKREREAGGGAGREGGTNSMS